MKKRRILCRSRVRHSFSRTDAAGAAAPGTTNGGFFNEVWRLRQVGQRLGSPEFSPRGGIVVTSHIHKYTVRI